jgi:mannose-1-phosphate guanylyltransferase
VLLGAAPEECDPELGWILPGGLDPVGLPTVAAFVEKPDRATAAALQAQGGLVNTFVFAVRASTLLDLCRRALPEITARLEGRAHGAESFGPALSGSLDELVSVYADLPEADFSGSVLEQAGNVLRVLRMEPCGWSDLGTPRRVAVCLRQLRERHGAEASARSRMQTGSLAARALVHEQRHRFELAF